MTFPWTSTSWQTRWEKHTLSCTDWAACVSSDDVEFDLGTSTVQGQGSEDEPFDFQHREVWFYLLD